MPARKAVNPTKKARGTTPLKIHFGRTFFFIRSIDCLQSCSPPVAATGEYGPSASCSAGRRLAVAGCSQGAATRRGSFGSGIQYQRLVQGHGSGHRAHYAGQQSRLSRAPLRREQPPRNHSREPGAHLVLVPDPDRHSKVLQGPATSGSTSTASTTPRPSGSTARRSARCAAPSSAASSTSRPR